MIRFRLHISTLLLTIAVITGCSREPAAPTATTSARQTERPAATTPISARIKWLPGATYIGSFVAKERGYWKEKGLDVTIRPGGFEADPIKLVAAGSDHFGVTGAEQLLFARSQGVPIVAIFAELRQSPAGWMTLSKSGITTPQQFQGKIVGAQYGTNIEPTLDALLGKLRIDPKKLKRVPVKYDVSPLFTGQVDVLPVYLNGQPVQARLEGHSINTIAPADYGLHLYGNVYFTSEEMIAKRPEVVAAFVSGLARGWQDAITNPERAVDDLVRAESSLDKKLEIEILRATIPFIKAESPAALGVMEPQRWSETKNAMVRYANLAADVDVTAAYTNKFISGPN